MLVSYLVKFFSIIFPKCDKKKFVWNIWQSILLFPMDEIKGLQQKLGTISQ